MPSILGIITSSSTASGSHSRTRARPLGPSGALRTLKPASESSNSSSVRISGSSSTTATRGMKLSMVPMVPKNRDQRLGQAWNPSAQAARTLGRSPTLRLIRGGASSYGSFVRESIAQGCAAYLDRASGPRRGACTVQHGSWTPPTTKRSSSIRINPMRRPATNARSVSLFKPPHGCAVVTGTISPNGWCTAWVKKSSVAFKNLLITR